MLFDYARPLDTNAAAFDFSIRVLGMTPEDADSASQYIMKAEKLLKDMKLQSTLESPEHRRPLYAGNDARVNLRRKIFDELIEIERLEDDESIELGKGGAKPITALKLEKQAVLLTGLPASGKSTIAGVLADNLGAYIIDSDYAQKRKIPEFDHEFGASVVHQESSLVTFGSAEETYKDEYNLYEYCIAKGYNMIIPKIGNQREKIEKIRDTLIDKGYVVHLILVSLDRAESCRRALHRYLNTQRYVPLGLVFDCYANDPILTYYRVRDSSSWQSVAKLSTIELRDKGAHLIHSTPDSPVHILKSEGIVYE